MMRVDKALGTLSGGTLLLQASWKASEEVISKLGLNAWELAQERRIVIVSVEGTVYGKAGCERLRDI